MGSPSSPTPSSASPIPPDLDVESLRLLVDVHDLGSISAAARVAGLSQPAVSARVRAMESRWRLVLVERSPRGTVPTPEGTAVVAWARRVLHEVDAMRAGLAAMAHERRASLAVAASLTIAEYMVPRWLGELRTRCADIRPNLTVVNSEAVVALVRSGDADIGFIEGGRLPLDLATRSIGSDRLAVVAEPLHPWSRSGEVVDRHALAAEEFVMRERGSGTRSTFEHALGSMPRLSLEVSSTAALIGAALAGVGPAVVSARAVAAHLELGRLVEVRHRLQLRRPLTAVWDSRRRYNDQAHLLLGIAVRESRTPEGE